MVSYRELSRMAALADVSVQCMKAVLQGADPARHRSRQRARDYLQRNRLLHLIETLPVARDTAGLLKDLAARQEKP